MNVDLSEQQAYPCGHSDTPVKFIGDPPYPVPIPSKGGSLCPVCFLADCRQTHFLEHEHRLNLGPLEADTPYNVWFSMLMRQREVMRYEHDLRLRIDLSEAAKERVWEAFLVRMRALSAHYDAQRWQAFVASHEPVYQETERTFTDALLNELLSGGHVPACDGAVTLKVIDVTRLSQAERVPLRTLDEWSMACRNGPLVLVCHKTALRVYGTFSYREILPEQVGYLVEDPLTLHLLWQATTLEFRQSVVSGGKRAWEYLERPFYRIDQPRILKEQHFLVKPSRSRFGLFWSFHLSHMLIMEPLRWVDELWDMGGVHECLQFAAQIPMSGNGGRSEPELRVTGTGHHFLCLYCTQPIDPARVGGEGEPEFCCEGCSAASRHAAYGEVYAQRVRRRQGLTLSCLGPVPAMCTCQHHDPTNCTMMRYHLTQAEMQRQFLPCRCACHVSEERGPINEEDWKNARQAWEERLREWREQCMEKAPMESK
jgi:hypothetical protein